jgi:cytosine/adenosine deaminase-related metal-dependent hydrolase
MHHRRWSLLVAVVAVSAMAFSPLHAQTPRVTIYEGARLLTGDGVVIDDSAFIVANDRFVGVGRRGQLPPPPGAVRVDLSGKTVMPTLIDDHVHMGYRKGTSFTADNYTRENLTDMLDRYAFYGIAAILETGTGRGDLPYQVRAAAHSSTR